MIKSTIAMAVGSIAGGYIGKQIGNKYDNPAYGTIIGTAIGLALSPLTTNSFEKNVTLYHHKMEYEADKISVETLGCHQAAIKNLNKWEASLPTHPSPNDRMARIQELFKKKEAKA